MLERSVWKNDVNRRFIGIYNFFQYAISSNYPRFSSIFMVMKDISEYQQHFKNCREPEEKFTFGSVMAWGCSTKVWKQKYLNNESGNVTTMNKILKRHCISFIQQLARPIFVLYASRVMLLHFLLNQKLFRRLWNSGFVWVFRQNSSREFIGNKAQWLPQKEIMMICKNWIIWKSFECISNRNIFDVKAPNIKL